METKKEVLEHRKRLNRKENFDKRVILEIVGLIESGVPRGVNRERHAVGMSTISRWMLHYASPAWQAVKQRSFSKEIRRSVLTALCGGMSVKEASVSFGINDTAIIRRWMKEKRQEDADLVQNALSMAKKNKAAGEHEKQTAEEKLAEAELKIRAPEMMIDLAEEQFRIDIRKKSGAKRPAG